MTDLNIIWTRLAPEPLAADGMGGMPPRGYDVGWEVAEDDRFTQIARRGTAPARPDGGHGVHVELGGLRPGHEYDPSSPAVGTELVATSITSGGDGSETREDTAATLAENPHVKFYNNRRGTCGRGSAPRRCARTSASCRTSRGPARRCRPAPRSWFPTESRA